jgi:hypothetical protein
MVNVFQKFHAYLKNLLILFPKGDRAGGGGQDVVWIFSFYGKIYAKIYFL